MTHPDLPPPETMHGNIVTGGGRHPHMIGILLILVALTLINCSDAVAKLTIEQVPVYQVALFQACAMILAVPFIARTTNLTQLVRTRRPGLQLIRSCCQFASAISFFSGLALLPLADIIAIIMLGPLMVTALAALVLKEKVGPRRWLACGFGLVGALIMIRPTYEGGMGLPALLPLAAVFFYSVYAVITRMLAPHHGTGTMMFWAAIVGFVVLIVTSPFYWQAPTPEIWLGLVVVAILSASSNGFTIRAYAHAPASLLAPFAYVEIIGGTILGYLIWHEFPDAITWLGIAIIVGSGLYVWHRERRLAIETG
ncbi:MAG: DMT family transporter [Pseudomonadota bacterium]